LAVVIISVRLYFWCRFHCSWKWFWSYCYPWISAGKECIWKGLHFTHWMFSTQLENMYLPLDKTACVVDH